jgi:hypothetical protein
MATMKKGILTRNPSYSAFWKHLRPYGKRMFWKRERKAAKHESRRQG